ncbi:hypothetical protein D0T53_13240 [Dysgonomonas sp. 216]|uniref:DUF6864 domain-containing function n=1 Tax=Dysgonomonas sp. 216 TaxID=2302934 RepID=UPI0013D0290B|nr:hypothetical protein [Dysgonomonas sp. 216]NDW19863.1 hypothetical protein [Dysgonomonas sp. 216]
MKVTKFETGGGWEILDTGVVIHYDEEKPFTLFVVEEDGTPIKVRLEFEKDDEVKEPIAKIGIFDLNTVLIKIKYLGFLSNFGLLKPMRLGTYNKKDILFNFRVDSNEKEDVKLIHYTWYLKEKEEQA